ncbi:MAG: hypothetical protein LBQ01_07865 [Prevotellaceae bacterium]|nr:hypothetical protein [Prevotellaceae bacterium]
MTLCFSLRQGQYGAAKGAYSKRYSPVTYTGTDAGTDSSISNIRISLYRIYTIPYHTVYGLFMRK